MQQTRSSSSRRSTNGRGRRNRTRVFMKRENPVDLYNNVYSGFGNDAEVAVRRQTYGEDIGQSSWMTASEWLRFADQLEVTAASEVLEVGSGSGGPAIYLALKRGCRV